MPDRIETDAIEMPRPTAAPITLASGIVLFFAGIALNYAMSIVGLVLFVAGLLTWVREFLPGRGHMHEPRADASRRPAPIVPRRGAVEILSEGKPGYRMRLPLHVHPISAGIKGGLLGGVLMTVPALLWGHLRGHGIWYPINLLAGALSPGVADLTTAELEQFRPALFVAGAVIHGAMSLVLGLMYGVLLPTLPGKVFGPLIWGGLLMPLIWSGVTHGLMGVVNPLLESRVDWPWFIASQFVFGIAAAVVVVFSQRIAVPPAGHGSDTEYLTR